MNAFKMEQNLSLANSVTDIKITSPELTFDASTDFNLAFFDTPSTSPPLQATPIKKEPDFEDYGTCDSGLDSGLATDQLFSPSSEFSSAFSTDDSKFTSLADSATLYRDSSPVSGQSITSPLPSPGLNSSPTNSAIVIKSEQSFQVADSSPTSAGSAQTKNFVPCKVCGDKASGYHYGVTSCEGCKGFFRRSIQKQIEYRCLRDGKCLVIRLNRNRCQFCRFKKCLAVGMSRDSVRYGRVPKRTRDREGSTDSRGTIDSVSVELVNGTPTENRNYAAYDLILTISQAHLANCNYTEDRTKSMVRKQIILKPHDGYSDPDAASSTAETLEQQKINWLQSFAVFLTPCIQKIVEFAKRVPGFVELPQDDQLMLIKGGFFELWLTRVSRLISSVDNTLTFSDGSFLTRQQLEVMFEPELVTSIFTFADFLNNMSLTDTEIGLFVAVILLSSERPGLTDPKLIEQLQDKIIEALRIQMSRTHASDVHMFQKLAQKLPELRQIGARHNEHLTWFRINWSQLRLPPLFAEIFDIPKCEEDLI